MDSAIREAAILTFSFRFINQAGLRDSLLKKEGSVTRDGLNLAGQRVFFRDIHRVERYHQQLVVAMLPFPTIGGGLQKYVIDGTSSIVIKISGFSEEVQNIINRRISTARLNDRRMHMAPEDLKEKFKKRNCPVCDAAIDVTDLTDTSYTWCEYCETIFDRYGYPLPGKNLYRICPETGFYDRVRDYKEHALYAYRNERRFITRTWYCSDTFAQLLYRKHILKNLPYLFGAISALWQKIRLENGRHPEYIRLAKANLLALEGKFREAEFYYNQMLHRLMHHPGLYMNMGLACLRFNKKELALEYFQKSLRSCSNYGPTLQLLEKYRSQEKYDHLRNAELHRM